jgi:hypothetical protein
MHKYLERENEVTFDKIFNQKIGKWREAGAGVEITVHQSFIDHH